MEAGTIGAVLSSTGSANQRIIRHMNTRKLIILNGEKAFCLIINTPYSRQVSLLQRKGLPILTYLPLKHSVTEPLKELYIYVSKLRTYDIIQTKQLIVLLKTSVLLFLISELSKIFITFFIALICEQRFVQMMQNFSVSYHH